MGLEIEAKVKVDGLDEIFSECTIVTLQAPPTEETYHMVGAQQLNLLRDGALFVNTARSHVVDEAALLWELERGRFLAALDEVIDIHEFQFLDETLCTIFNIRTE